MHTLPENIEIIRPALRESYGMEGSLSRLPGENLNYLVQTESGQKYIAKIAGDETSPEVIDMERAALQHAIKASLGIFLPEIIANKYGKYETGINIHINEYKRLRLIKYVAGTDMSNMTDISENLRFEVGETLARFDQAMLGFDHPAAHRQHRWDLADAAQHRHKIRLVEDPEKHALLSWAFEQITNIYSSFIGQVPWQFIHGDPNPENIRIEGDRVVGLIDFGDSCYNPAVCDLAICLAYQMMDLEAPWGAAAQVIAGYESVRPLSDTERLILLPLVCGRLAVTISVATERRHIDPDNANWFVSEIPAWRLLGQLHSSGRTSLPIS